MPRTAESRRLALSIFAVSVVALFLEMALIRWVSTEVRIFSYLQNSILVAAFLGLGLGCHRARAPVTVLPAALALVAIGVVVRDPFGWEIGEGVTHGLVAYQDEVIWHTSLHGIAPHSYLRTALVSFSLVTSIAILAAVALAFFPLGQRLGAWMDRHPRPIAAYTANLLGSLAGIALFDALTLARTPPWLWLALCTVGLLWFAWISDEAPWRRAVAAAIALLLPLAGVTPGGDETRWSPYQKLALTELWDPLSPEPVALECGRQIEVNNVGYQSLIDLDRGRMAEDPDTYPPPMIPRSPYFLPYELIGVPERVLIVGAGSGNDVAAALEMGAGHVTAVEIDPVIVEWGRRHHPNAPYASERVEVIVDDARASFHRDRAGDYDLVWFGLLDSHTTPSAHASVRLDHFVYTRESFAEVAALLDEDGVVVLYFEPMRWYIAERLALLLGETFGVMPIGLNIRSTTPCLGYGGLLLIGARPETLGPIRDRIEAVPDLRERLIRGSEWKGDVRLTTDDWPYLYLERPSIPKFFLLLGAVCLGVGVVLRRRLFSTSERLDIPLLLLGAGFMLLEVTAVSRASLLFGTTWTVNAYVVGAVLSMALLANLTASLVKVRPGGWPFLGLVGTLLALALVPTAPLAALPLAARVLVGAAFLSAPVYFSGLVFVTLWSTTERKDSAFGSNLLGALVGGLMSMLTMQIGFRGLTWVTIVIYGIVFALVVRRGKLSRAA